MASIPFKPYLNPRLQAHQAANSQPGAGVDPLEASESSDRQRKDAKGATQAEAPGARAVARRAAQTGASSQGSRSLSMRESKALPAAGAGSAAVAKPVTASAMPATSAQAHPAPSDGRPDASGLPPDDLRQGAWHLVQAATPFGGTPERCGAWLASFFEEGRDGPPQRLRSHLDALAALGAPWPDAIASAVERYLPQLSPVQIERLASHLPREGGALLARASHSLSAPQFGATVMALAQGLDLRAAADGKAPPGGRDKARERLRQDALSAVLASDPTAAASRKLRESAKHLVAQAFGRNSPSDIEQTVAALHEQGLSQACSDKLRYLLLVMGSSPRITSLRHQRDQVIARLAGLRGFDPQDDALRELAAADLRKLYEGYAKHCTGPAGDAVRPADRQQHLRFIDEESAWLRGLVDHTGNLRGAKQVIQACLGAWKAQLQERR